MENRSKGSQRGYRKGAVHYTRQARSFRTAWFRVKKYRDDEQREWKDI